MRTAASCGLVRHAPDQHRTGPHDYSRKIWTLLVFMLCHGIFVEQRITPDVPADLVAQVNRVQDQIASGEIKNIPDTLG